MSSATQPEFGERPEWGVGRPRFRAFRVLVAWAVSALMTPYVSTVSRGTPQAIFISVA